MNDWYLALSQIKRNPLRSGLMAIGVVIAAVVITTAAILIAGINESMTNTAKRLGADLMVVPGGEEIAQQFNEALITGKPTTFYLEQATVEKVSQVPGVTHAAAHIFVETLTNARCCAGKFFIVGFNPEADFTITPWLKDDVSLPATYEHDRMIVGDRILLHKGDVADFYGTPFTVAGVLEPTGTGMDWTIYISHQSLWKMVSNSMTRAEMPLRISEGDVSAVFIKAESGADLIDLAEKIEQAAPGAQVILSSTVAKFARNQLSGIAGLLGFIVIGLWVMALALSGVVFSMAVRERRSQLGLLVAKGAEKRFVFGMLTKESVMIAAPSSLSGCIVGLLIVISFRELLSNALGASDVLPAAVTMVAFIAVFSIFGTLAAVITAIMPVIPILRIEPYEAIKQGKTT
ncbi:MAG: ABC transporter permease [Planctomycetes bacterium]|nr:ABC transporter permease [Planctomycetota bacterium]